jgi:hypothetical protein
MSPQSWYIPQALTNLSQQYRNPDDSYIQDAVAPVLLVERKTGKYAYYTKSNLRKPTNSLRTGKEKTPEIDMNVEWKDYTTLQEHSLKMGVEKDVMEQYLNPLDPMFDTTRQLMDSMMIEREVNLATKLSDTTVITQYTTPSVLWNASTGAGSPFSDIVTGINTMNLNGLRRPNAIIMGAQVWNQLANHPDLIDRVKYSQLGALTTELFAQLISSSAANCNITRVLIGTAVYDSSVEQSPPPGTATNGFIWGKNLWLAYLTPTPGLREVNGMYTLVLRNGRYVDGWPSQDRKTTWVRVNDYYSQFVVGAEAFYLLSGVVA